MSARRHNSEARSTAAARDISSVTLVERGPEEGKFSTRYSRYLDRHVAQLRFRGRVFDGVGADEEEAERRALAVAAELTGLQTWQVQDEMYGDEDSPATRPVFV